MARWFAAFSMAVALAVVAWGCGDSNVPPPLRDGMGAVAPLFGSGCTEGASRSCGVEIGTYNGVVDCTTGTMACGADGTWGPCVPGRVGTAYRVPAPRPISVSLRGHVATPIVGGTSVPCSDNPCDPACSRFDDAPDAAYTDPSTSVVVAVTGGSLASSNVPSGFQKKGSLSNQCASPCTTMQCQEACQFDQHCVQGACAPFAATEHDSCSGVDITAPTTCNNSNGSRMVTVCNRGTVAAPPGIGCYVFPGGSPQYPNASPSLSSGTLVMTTQTMLAPGGCETQTVPGSAFTSNGTRSMMCNPPGSQPGGTATSATLGPDFPATSSGAGWANPQNGYAADGQYATSASASSTTGATYPTALAQNGGWSGSAGALTSVDSVFETLKPAIVGGSAPDFPSAFSASSGWTNPRNAYANDGVYATASPAVVTLGPATTTSATYPTTYASSACVGGSSCAFTGPTAAYAGPDGVYASATVGSSSTAIIYYGGFDFSAVPSNAVITGLQITATWSAGRHLDAAAIQAFTAAGAAIGTALTPSAYNGQFNTDTQASSFSAGTVTRADLMGGSFIRVTATKGNGAADVISIDDITVKVTYATPTAAPSTVMLQGFHFDAVVPPGAVITQLTTRVAAHVSGSNPDVTLSFQAFKGAQATPIDAAFTATATSPALTTADQVLTQSVSTAALGALSGADLYDANFGVSLSVRRAYDPSDSGAFTVSVDYVQVTVNYTYAAGTNTVTLTNFGISIPSGATVLDVKTSASWFVSASNPNVVLGLQPSTGNGAVSIGPLLATTPGASPPTVETTQSVDATTKSGGAAILPSDLADGNFSVQMWAARAPGTNNPDVTAYVDAVSVTVAYVMPNASSVTYGTFGFNSGNLPAGSLTRVTVSTKWHISTANANAVLSFQAYTGGGATAIGSPTTTTVGTSPPTTDTVVSSDLDVSSLSPTDLYDGNFFVQVTASRGNATLPNPDFIAYLDYVTVTVTSSTTSGGQVVECNPYNNWSVAKGSPADPCQNITQVTVTPTTITRVFDGTTCPAGTRVQWQLFGYSAAAPADSSVQFRFQSFSPTGSPAACAAAPALTASPPSPVVAASTPTDTQTCAVNAVQTASCPVNLYSYLGGLPAAQLGCLQMDATLVPSSDGTMSPSLKSWDVAFDCIPSE